MWQTMTFAGFIKIAIISTHILPYLYCWACYSGIKYYDDLNWMAQFYSSIL
jgi:hypothetical protein